MEKEKEEKVEEERGWTCVEEADMGGTDEKRRTYEGARREVASTKESKDISSRWSSLSSKSRACLREPNSPRTQATGGGAVVGEVTARVGVGGGRWPVRTRGLPSNDTRRGSHVLLDSPEVTISERTQSKQHRRDGCIVVGGSGKVTDLGAAGAAQICHITVLAALRPTA